MKKILSLSILLLVTLSSCQQAKAELTLQKGVKKVYVTECTVKSPQHDEFHMSTVQEYEVVDEAPEGYVLDIWVKDIQKDEKNPPGMSLSTTMDILKGRHTQYITDKEGRVLRCLSINEVKEQYRENYMSVHEFTPHGNDSVANEEWRKIKEQEDVAVFQGTISPLALNGKDIKDGTEEEYTEEATYTFQPDGWVKTIDCVIHTKDKEPVTLIYKVYCK